MLFPCGAATFDAAASNIDAARAAPAARAPAASDVIDA
jgi:hypothetical protein